MGVGFEMSRRREGAGYFDSRGSVSDAASSSMTSFWPEVLAWGDLGDEVRNGKLDGNIPI